MEDGENIITSEMNECKSIPKCDGQVRLEKYIVKYVRLDCRIYLIRQHEFKCQECGLDHVFETTE